MKKTLIASITATTLSSVAFPSLAAIELTDNLSLSGFGSTSWATTDNKTPVLVNRFIDDENCYDCDTTLGVQLDFYYDAFKASAQVVKRPQDHWSDPQLEWAYLAYTYGNIEFRGGRLRMPVFLASEYYYVGHAFTPARPPNEVYDSILGITAFNGISFLWNYDINDSMTLTTTPFVGFHDESTVDFNDRTELTFTTNEMYGINFILSGDYYRWNFTYMDSSYDQETKLSNFPVQLPDGSVMVLPSFTDRLKDQSIKLYSLGAEYEFDAFTLTVEGQTNDIASSWYAQGAYNLNKFTPYVTYGQQFDDHEHKVGDSYLLGVRYDLHYNVSLNAEWQHFKAYRNVSGAFVDTPEDDNANMYTIMVNFVF
ncbi:Porin_4 domain-containing protein [Vibrio harveyi]|uniref:porin n=1 Tax=Vibrio harveyi TaxID=669 RepID=UPI001EFC89EE|nr:porin [Vibrio harveyi]EKO3833850.1 porin [Vibrio harveyi]MCG9235759.1 porin [Vibrio harveyi]MCG9586028.1 porin [Vibrio harveyi]CAH1206631.1 Porin_4 domain-containing protein [Vibrio harveyi]CAH1550156.1 Porin_4 domain-containing protein [Vibrio harveyi]